VNAIDSVLHYWPALLAFVLASAIPRGEDKTKERVGFGVVAAALAVLVQALWPSDAMPTEAATPPTEWRHLLNLLVFLPIAAGTFLLFLPRQLLGLLRGFTLAVMGVCFVASLWLLAVPMTAGWHFQYIHEWIPSFGIRYHVAIDGISLWLVVLTTFITPIAAYAAFGSIQTRIKELCFSLLLMQGAMVGVFVSLDLFLFYVFWELVLVPMYVMIGVWGGVDRIRAAIKFFLYTMTGSMLMLAAMVYLVWTFHKLTGSWSWDLLALSRVVLGKNAQFYCFWAFSIAFFIKVPMWPVHTWLPDAHVQAPTSGSVILAALMLKLGTYAFLRFSMGLFPGMASRYSGNLAGVAILGGIIYGALVAWKQDDVKRVVAYSSVAHLGYVMLGLFSVTPAGMQGAVLQMVNHGISTGALFMLVGVIYDRRHTRMLDEFGGLAKVMPYYAAVFVIVTLASVGVPGTNGFIGEFMVITGTFVSERLGVFSGIQTIGAAAGVILAAVYMLSIVQKMFFGPVSNPKNKHLPDLTQREALALAPLVGMIFVIGLFPNVFLDRTQDAVRLAYNQFKAVSDQQVAKFGDENAAKLLTAEDFNPAFLKGSPEVKLKEGGPSAANDRPGNSAVALNQGAAR
jgi:NADH-quinone oxidoreductase subunit M